VPSELVTIPCPDLPAVVPMSVDPLQEKMLRRQIHQMIWSHHQCLIRELDDVLAVAFEKHTPNLIAEESPKPESPKPQSPKPRNAAAFQSEADGVKSLWGMDGIRANLSEHAIKHYVKSNTKWSYGLMRKWKNFVEKNVQQAEPKRSGVLYNIVSSKAFEFTVIVVITLNLAFTVYETDWQMKHRRSHLTSTMVAIEVLFTCVYLVEIALKLLVHRMYFFCNKHMYWNVFDLFLIVSGSLDTLWQLIFSGSPMGSPLYMRIARVGQRLFRVFRYMRFFHDLRLMLRCILGSLVSLFWSFILLALCTVLFAIVLVQQFSAYLIANPNTVKDEFLWEANRQFGSVSLASVTLFKCISGGSDWGSPLDLVVQTGRFSTFTFMVYIILVWLALMNVIVSLFVEKAMKLAQPDEHDRMLEKMTDDLANARELRDLFDTIDRDNSQSISRSEIQQCLDDVKIASYFQMKGLDTKNAAMFFDLLTSQGHESTVDVDTFISGWLQLRGPASSIDVMSLQHKFTRKSDKIMKLLFECNKDIANVAGQLHRHSSMCAGGCPRPSADEKHDPSREQMNIQEEAVSDTSVSPIDGTPDKDDAASTDRELRNVDEYRNKPMAQQQMNLLQMFNVASAPREIVGTRRAAADA